MAQMAKQTARDKDITEAKGEIYIRTRKDIDPSDLIPGGKAEAELFPGEPGSFVNSISVTVTGTPFRGVIEAMTGAKVTLSPILYDTSGSKISSGGKSEQAFVVDFGGIRSIMLLELLDFRGLFSLVIPWLGNDFAAKSIFPASQEIPLADSNGTVEIGTTGVETTKLFIQVYTGEKPLTAEEFGKVCRITTATSPLNVKASMNGRPPFWTHPGALNGSVLISGLEKELNALLKGAKETLPVKLALTSDTPGSLSLAFDAKGDLDMDLSATARWGNQGSTELMLQGMQVAELQLPFEENGKTSWQLSRLVLEMSGKFPPWRTYQAEEENGGKPLAMRVDARFSVARQLSLTDDGELRGFYIPLVPVGGKGELLLELFTDSDNHPASGKPLAAAECSVSSDAIPPSGWVEVLLPAPLKLKKGEVVWLQAKAKTGRVEWGGCSGVPGGEAITLFSDEGGVWQEYPDIGGAYPLPALRILRLPFTGEHAPLLKVKMEEKEGKLVGSSELDSTPLTMTPNNSVTIDPENGRIQLPLRFEAGAGGKLTVNSATIYYKKKDSDDA